MPIDGFAAYDYSSFPSAPVKSFPLAVIPAIPLTILPKKNSPSMMVSSSSNIVTNSLSSVSQQKEVSRARAAVSTKNKIRKNKKTRMRMITIPEAFNENSDSDDGLQPRAAAVDEKRFIDELKKQHQQIMQKPQANLKTKIPSKTPLKPVEIPVLNLPAKIETTSSNELMRQYEEKLRIDIEKSKLKLGLEENLLARNSNSIHDSEITDNIKEQVDRVKTEISLIPVLPQIKDNAGWIGAGVTMTMAGLILAPVTWGVSLGVSCLGMGVALLGSIIAVVRSIQYFVNKCQYKNDMRDYLNNHFIENRHLQRVGEIHGKVYHLKESPESLGFVMREDGFIESFRKMSDGHYLSTGIFSDITKAVRMVKADHISDEFKLKNKKTNISSSLLHSSSLQGLTLFGTISTATDKTAGKESQRESYFMPALNRLA